MYIQSAVNSLLVNPSKLAIVRNNCENYKKQFSMNKGLLKAIERLEWVFYLDDDVERIAKQVLNDDYIGKRIQRYPLLFKGVNETSKFD
ncbi:putative orphan protein [Pseudoalteromonas luteoviolacea B = ATCC 29581]|nr:putative orphan protein [Pseudoalteromonas luteoviolacea B = ATCC 29581]